MVRPMTNPDRKAYGIKIRKAREARKLIKGAVASKLGQPIWMIDKIERGEPVIWHPNVYLKLEEAVGLIEPAKSSSLSSSASLQPSPPSSAESLA